MKNISKIVIALFAIGIGLYPLMYFLVDMSQGLLGAKDNEILGNLQWQIAFYTHIIAGGIGLLIGWTQFSAKIRRRRLRVHRTIGKIYVVSCLLAGTAGLYLAVFATGGLVASLGFGSLAMLWILTTAFAFLSIRRKQVEVHQAWMTRSYALAFAAVTLRIWLPFLGFAMGLEFITSYQIAAWLCWVPNLVVAEMIVRNRRNKLVPALP